MELLMQCALQMKFLGAARHDHYIGIGLFSLFDCDQMRKWFPIPQKAAIVCNLNLFDSSGIRGCLLKSGGTDQIARISA